MHKIRYKKYFHVTDTNVYKLCFVVSFLCYFVFLFHFFVICCFISLLFVVSFLCYLWFHFFVICYLIISDDFLIISNLSEIFHVFILLFKEVWYNCSAHRSAHLFIIEISSHRHIKRKRPQRILLQYSYSVTMINIVKKYLRREIHELNTLIGCSDDS